MARLDIPTNPAVDVGLDQPDDAAVITVPPEKLPRHTVDFFRSFVGYDPYIFSGKSRRYTLSVTAGLWEQSLTLRLPSQVPYGLEPQVEETLYQMMAGATKVLKEVGVRARGGHSCEGTELALGFAVHGVAERKN